MDVRIDLGWSMSRTTFTAGDFKGATPMTLKRGTCLIYEGDVREQCAYFIIAGRLTFRQNAMTVHKHCSIA